MFGRLLLKFEPVRDITSLISRCLMKSRRQGWTLGSDVFYVLFKPGLVVIMCRAIVYDILTCIIPKRRYLDEFIRLVELYVNCGKCYLDSYNLIDILLIGTMGIRQIFRSKKAKNAAILTIFTTTSS